MDRICLSWLLMNQNTQSKTRLLWNFKGSEYFLMLGSSPLSQNNEEK
jgi:hypothetical protein